MEEYGAKSQEAVPALAEKTQEIAARLEQGESFEALMAEYSIDSTHQDVQDPGFLFHPQSENWAEAFRAASAALEQPGDVSGPLPVSYTHLHSAFPCACDAVTKTRTPQAQPAGFGHLFSM